MTESRAQHTVNPIKGDTDMRGMVKSTAAVCVSLMVVVMMLVGCGGMKTSFPSADYTKMENEFGASHGNNAFSFWHGLDGGHRAIGIDGDALVIHDLDSGESKRFGKTGDGKGEFSHPSAIAVEDDLLFVLEQGNRRIQVLHLPDLESFGFFGEEQLRDPSALALYRIENASFYLYVADTFNNKGQQTDIILRYSVSRGVNTIHGLYLQSFGYTSANGWLENVRSLKVDQEKKQVLVDAGGSVRAYTLEGDAARP